MIRILPVDQAMAFVNAHPGKFIVYIQSHTEEGDFSDWLNIWTELCKAAPYLEDYFDSEQTEENNLQQVVGDQQGFVICDTREEMESIYWQTVGDDGPIDPKIDPPGNLYDGKARWYALTINDKGETENENT